ncbi:putative dehydrogenase [Kineococcus xinjiangensis]|uniref:Putative dehydrogenase n=1 Tax=Kineococcus xinjiangensis TaxID=512762 RepID=A0A2S6IH48_9ACTN|nr:Gfo/Idh/MocA family oxidoreductase [Kineococcus xinjiangensis]PPK93506.1 putative dehydrogenase [Kineococcus xinjiangensis]
MTTPESAPTAAAPYAGRRLRWGIAATGGIARSFAADLPLLDGSELVAVASRTPERAAAFAAQVPRHPGSPAPRAHGSYAGLFADEDVDVVYVATPHSAHHEVALAAIAAGKHVLVEKAFTLTGAQARDVVAAARAAGVFACEAMWARWQPGVVRLRELVESGAVGSVHHVTSSFGFPLPFDPAHRLYDPLLGGGALLDLGIYPLSFASMVLGVPEEVRALAAVGGSGVDEAVGFTCRHPGGGLSTGLSTLRASVPAAAVVAGSSGRIVVEAPFFHPSVLRLERDGHEPEVLELAWEGGGYQFEAAEVERCLRAGLRESPAMPLAETVALMDLMDEVRRQVGVRYAGE